MAGKSRCTGVLQLHCCSQFENNQTWKEGKAKTKVDWEPGSVLVPPDMVYHQYFCTGNTSARYLAIRWGGHKHPVFMSYALGVDKNV